MSKKDEKIEKFVRDAESKAKSLYRAGYKDGYNSGYKDGYAEAEYEEENKVDLAFGDLVLDQNGLRAIVVNNDTHIHLLYIENGKTWKVPNNLKHTLKPIGLKGHVEINWI